MPSRIQPTSGTEDTPSNSTKIQLALNGSLPYGFVLENQVSQTQIFKFTGVGLRYSLDVASDRVVVADLVPYPATSDENYIHTIIESYIPSSEVSTLQLQILNRNSDFYQQENPSAKTLFSMIDSTWPLTGSDSSSTSGDSSSSGTGSGSASSETDATQANAVSGDDSGSSSVKASSVGIATGVIAGAALYGTAMFFVAKRYRKRKAAHQRTSSVLSGQRDMSQFSDGPGPLAALMSGGRGHGFRSTTPGGRDSRNSGRSGSARTQFISPPVAAENSLGWN
ncbi:putative mucin family signaling protein msb2 [Phaeomoniella chlamydospora]|uniref:Putative mucin family signaling protein msb2 n=1 Tax=Phaeomoniella chlamydospora TaxID=158046 RepID=A0A0G2E9H8_PHACM|nr:putative mucin family signaling protein msb2 [Phaeomoniella chlamydospora]